MAFALDCAVVLVITLCAVVGYLRGFVRYAIKMLGTLVCVVLALIVSDLAASPVYERLVKPALSSAIEQRLENVDIAQLVRKGLEEAGFEGEITDERLNAALTDSGSIANSVAEAAEESGASTEEAELLEKKMEEYFSGGFVSGVCEQAQAKGFEDFEYSSGLVYDVIRCLSSNNSTEQGAEYITDNVISSASIIVVRWVLFILVLIVAESVLAIVFAIAGVFDSLPAVSFLNRFLGVLMGLIKGFMYMLLIAFIISALGGTNEIISMGIDGEISQETYIFRYIYGIAEKITSASA